MFLYTIVSEAEAAYYLIPRFETKDDTKQIDWLKLKFSLRGFFLSRSEIIILKEGFLRTGKSVSFFCQAIIHYNGFSSSSLSKQTNLELK